MYRNKLIPQTGAAAARAATGAAPAKTKSRVTTPAMGDPWALFLSDLALTLGQFPEARVAVLTLFEKHKIDNPE